MAWYEDLTESDSFAKHLPVACLNVGWLENEKPFKTGKLSKKLLKKINEFNKTPGVYIRFLGYHNCDFCDFIDVELGATTFLIAYKNKVYICPALIVHYIEAHQYLPPPEFIEAVQNYDHQQAMAYFKEIRENKLIKPK